MLSYKTDTLLVYIENEEIVIETTIRTTKPGYKLNPKQTQILINHLQKLLYAKNS